MAKGSPKVTVRVDSDDPEEAARLALKYYTDTVNSFNDAPVLKREPAFLDPDMDPRITG